MVERKTTLEIMVRENQTFWKSKTVLITGHSGFKGSWLTMLLNYLGANVIGFSLEEDNNNFLYKKISGSMVKDNERIISRSGDIRDIEALSNIVNYYQPDIVFHLAAQPLVKESYRDPINTWNTNVIEH